MAEPYEPLYTAAEMRAAEERYPDYPESIPELMERAGTAVAREAMLAFPAARSFACVCGGGSNGGDGRVAARVLREAGHVADETNDLDGYDVVVDALFGTGFSGEPRPEAAELIARMNASAAPVVAVDVPSGVDASTGEIAGAAVEADLTVTFHAPKVGLAIAPGRFHAGRVVVADIGLEDAPDRGATCDARASRDDPEAERAGHEVQLRLRPRRRRPARHDRSGVPHRAGRAPRGRGLRDARSPGGLARRGGGPRARAGEDPVDATTTRSRRSPPPPSARPRLRSGPGLGRSPQRRALVRALLERVDLPAVVDADALFELEPSRARGADGAHAARRRAGPPARRGSRLGRRAPARRCARRGSAIPARSSCSRAPTRSSPRPTGRRSSATSAHRRSRRPARGTC